MSSSKSHTQRLSSGSLDQTYNCNTTVTVLVTLPLSPPLKFHEEANNIRTISNVQAKLIKAIDLHKSVIGYYAFSVPTSLLLGRLHNAQPHIRKKNLINRFTGKT